MYLSSIFKYFIRNLYHTTLLQQYYKKKNTKMKLLKFTQYPKKNFLLFN